MGFVRGIDFVVGQRPPKSWTAEPLVAPEEWKHTMAWANGTVIYFISQDGVGNPNSLSLQWGIVDETKLIDKPRFDTDLMPTLRGYRHLWEHLPEYKSLLFMTDQPTDPEGQWIWEKEKLMDSEKVQMILRLHASINDASAKLKEAKSARMQEEYQQKIGRLLEYMRRLRMGLVYYIEANVRANIHVLGLDFVRQQERGLPRNVFEVSILNKRNMQVVGGFYGLLSARHCYTRFADGYLRKLSAGDDHDLDCRQDGDIDPNQPLYIGMDHGASINCMSIGQGNRQKVRIINFMYVLHPETTEELAVQFCNYYAPHQSKNKEVVFIFDQTAIAESGKASNITYKKEMVDVLVSRGWKVTEMYLGRTPGHSDRYKLWSRYLKLIPDPGYGTVMFNETHTEVLRIAMYGAKALNGRKDNEIKKDKKSERQNIPQQKATHPTDSADILLWGITRQKEQRKPRVSTPAMYA